MGLRILLGGIGGMGLGGRGLLMYDSMVVLDVLGRLLISLSL